METLTIEKKETQIKTPEKDFDLTEIINGEEIVPPSPFGKHQRIITRIATKIILHLEKNKTGELLFSPLDVILEEKEQEVQPDLLFIKKENMGIFQDWVRGAPDMVCEVVSKGSVKKDTITKKELYEKYQIPEYWIVLPEFETIEILTIENNKYEVFSSAEGEGSVNSKVIEGLTVDVKDVFED